MGNAHGGGGQQRPCPSPSVTRYVLTGASASVERSGAQQPCLGDHELGMDRTDTTSNAWFDDPMPVQAPAQPQPILQTPQSRQPATNPYRAYGAVERPRPRYCEYIGSPLPSDTPSAVPVSRASSVASTESLVSDAHSTSTISMEAETEEDGYDSASSYPTPGAAAEMLGDVLAFLRRSRDARRHELPTSSRPRRPFHSTGPSLPNDAAFNNHARHDNNMGRSTTATVCPSVALDIGGLSAEHVVPPAATPAQLRQFRRLARLPPDSPLANPFSLFHLLPANPTGSGSATGVPAQSAPTHLAVLTSSVPHAAFVVPGGLSESSVAGLRPYRSRSMSVDRGGAAAERMDSTDAAGFGGGPAIGSYDAMRRRMSGSGAGTGGGGGGGGAGAGAGTGGGTGGGGGGGSVCDTDFSLDMHPLFTDDESISSLEDFGDDVSDLAGRRRYRPSYPPNPCVRLDTIAYPPPVVIRPPDTHTQAEVFVPIPLPVSSSPSTLPTTTLAHVSVPSPSPTAISIPPIPSSRTRTDPASSAGAIAFRAPSAVAMTAAAPVSVSVSAGGAGQGGGAMATAAIMDPVADPAADAQAAAAAAAAAATSTPAAPPAPTTTDSYGECVVCLSMPRDTSLLHGDSAHLCCCYACAQRLYDLGSKCPMCRRPVDFVVRTFF